PPCTPACLGRAHRGRARLRAQISAARRRLRKNVRHGRRREDCTQGTARTRMNKLLPTTLVGSYPQPDWLIDREKLSKQVPRVRMDLWLVDDAHLEAKQDEATLLAIKDQESAGLDIITDGEQRRESYSNRFATALAGVDTENPGTTINRMGKPIPVPRVAAKIGRETPILLRDLQFLRANTAKPVKMTIPGPFTMSKQAQNDFYSSDEEMALDFGAAVNAEIKDLFAAG